MVSVSSNIALQQWRRLSLFDKPCGLCARFDDLQTLQHFVFANNPNPVYGKDNPKEERLLQSQQDIQEQLTEIGMDVGDIELESQKKFLIIVHLRSHNHVVIRKIPKDWKDMWGSQARRDQVLQNMADIEKMNPHPMEFRTVPKSDKERACSDDKDKNIEEQLKDMLTALSGDEAFVLT